VTIAAAILVAAGPGTRLGAGVPKAFVDLCGAPIVAHSLRALTRASCIASAVVVVPGGSIDDARAALAPHIPTGFPVAIVAGGAERQDSVRNGLAAVDSVDVIAIHDAARPFVSPGVVDDAIAAAARHGAAIVAVPATDTVKRVHPDGWIESTPPRQHIWLAQTPQAFRADLIRSAHAAAAQGDATDDAMLVERLGVRVYVVRGNAENRKITTPEDLQWAEWLLSRSAAPR
jgi:2-C-methyl-D-erythritol 4-phosphate cytidylyltransferase